MSARTSSAFALSLSLHALVALVIAFFAYTASRQAMEEPKIFELVAGEGDNYAEKFAPALGTPEGVKVELPKMPEPRPAPPEPVQQPVQEAPPIVPAPLPPPPVKETVKPAPKAVDPAKDIAKQIRSTVARAENKAKKEVAKQRAAEQKRLELEKKRLEQEQKRMTKEEFDRANAAKTKTTSPSKSAPPKIAKIDAAGIAKGVVGGSVQNKVGGAGGKALVASDGKLVELYYALLKQNVRRELVGLAGMDDQLGVTVVFHISATGTISRVRVKKSSGNDDFDGAVMAAFGRVNMPDHPEKRGEDLELTFRTRDIEER